MSGSEQKQRDEFLVTGNIITGGTFMEALSPEEMVFEVLEGRNPASAAKVSVSWLGIHLGNFSVLRDGYMMLDRAKT